MKKLILAVVALSAMLFSITGFADKVVIHGTPTIVEKRADVYVPKTTVITPSDYYYFTIDNTQRVCYREVQPSLTNIDVGIFGIKLGNDVVKLHCYTYSPDYFVIQ